MELGTVAFTVLANAERKLRAKAVRSQQKPGTTFGHNERIFVDHSYTDHNDDQPTFEEMQAIAKLNSRENFLSDRRTMFPLRLHKVLERASANEKSDIISWQPHGRAFKIHDKKRFEREVLFPVLKMKTMSSFIKQLSLYGFRRLTRGSGIDAGGYYHELFLCGREFLASRMQRETHKGMGHRAAATPDQEPDFYKMPPCFSTDTELLSDPLDELIEGFMVEDAAAMASASEEQELAEETTSTFEGIPFFLLDQLDPENNVPAFNINADEVLAMSL
mmetsp:Transcript_95/g.173  ORF Transcript_95/g.173 Transcript_95/m.173 type:complete len:276 (+) Transcript_95:454-1281(+)|eukprot:CAMPEP_0196817514 /NCGR_PEP_ID=MMETSP1362-20130617/61172_1 /TAXON_ID=163516 /ORGANISM="Leptocylindrus danicus, Strain CCMP1856" /LENGTH=275 /DNA_ID=CAMNT_0042195239 /DNA_START=408 /DNA_END=1235 /DNA_ORIENTATION=+